MSEKPYPLISQSHAKCCGHAVCQVKIHVSMLSITNKRMKNLHHQEIEQLRVAGERQYKLSEKSVIHKKAQKKIEVDFRTTKNVSKTTK